MSMYVNAKVVVEFMDGETRTYSPVGGAMRSPTLTGDGNSVVTLQMEHQSGAGAGRRHVASVPLCNIRSYRVEAE